MRLDIKKTGNGVYMIGGKRIIASIINGNLMIRVGGGYVNIEEFMRFYMGGAEMKKMAGEVEEDSTPVVD